MPQKKRKKQKVEQMDNELHYGIDYDDYHARIMGFTSGGASYGITWEEAKRMEGSTEDKNDEDDFDFIQSDIGEEYNPDHAGNKEVETGDLSF